MSKHLLTTSYGRRSGNIPTKGGNVVEGSLQNKASSVPDERVNVQFSGHSRRAVSDSKAKSSHEPHLIGIFL
jgi:hypothetical protein